MLLDWTGDEHGHHLATLESEIETFVDQYHGAPLAELNLGQMLADVTALLRDHHLALPADMALLIKAFITLEGMGRGLDPDFHMTTEALPLLKRVIRERYRPQAMARRGWATLRRTLAVAEQLPHDVSRLLRNARRGRVHVGIELAHLKRVGDQIDRAANRLTMALVIAALIIGSSHRHDRARRPHPVRPARLRLPGLRQCFCRRPVAGPRHLAQQPRPGYGRPELTWDRFLSNVTKIPHRNIMWGSPWATGRVITYQRWRSYPWQRGCRSGPAMARCPPSHGVAKFSLLLSDPLPWMGHRFRRGVDNPAPAPGKSVGHPGTQGLPMFGCIRRSA